MIDKSKEYKRLFRVQGLRFLVDDIFMEHYKKLAALTVFVDNYFTSYLSQEVINKCLADGLRLYGDKEAFNKYSTEFTEFKKKVFDLGQRISQEELSKESLIKAFEIFSKFFSYYSKTEFYYTDTAFSEAKTNAVLKNNLKSFGYLKNSGREELNRIFYGDKGYLNIILAKLSNRFSVNVDDLQHYSVNEILKLFDGEKVLLETINQRKNAFIILSDGQKTYTSSGSIAKKTIKDFQNENIGLTEIKGTSASGGTVKGRVKIIVSGYDNYNELNKIINEMSPGEILISETTSPELTLACQKAKAIVTNQGGMLSHAAIISRELNIPCVVGTENATQIFKDGDLVEVDANKGIVRKIR